MKQYTKSRPFKPEASHENLPLQIIWFHSISFQWILWINSTMKAMKIGIKPILIKPLDTNIWLISPLILFSRWMRILLLGYICYMYFLCQQYKFYAFLQ